MFITVQCVRPPIANDDGPYNTPEGEDITVVLTDNDVDPDGGDVRIYEIVDAPSSGTVTIDNDDEITYSPTPLCCDQSHHKRHYRYIHIQCNWL